MESDESSKKDEEEEYNYGEEELYEDDEEIHPSLCSNSSDGKRSFWTNQVNLIVDIFIFFLSTVICIHKKLYMS